MTRKEGRSQLGKNRKEGSKWDKSFQGLLAPTQMHTRTVVVKECPNFLQQVRLFPTCLLKVMNAEVMIGGEGFTQWSGTAQVNVLRLSLVVIETMILLNVLCV